MTARARSVGQCRMLREPYRKRIWCKGLIANCWYDVFLPSWTRVRSPLARAGCRRRPLGDGTCSRSGPGGKEGGRRCR